MAKSSYSGNVSVITLPLSAHARESGHPVLGQRTGSPLSRGRAEQLMLSLFPLLDRLMDRQHFLRAQDNRHVDHLAVDRDRAAPGGHSLVIGGNDLARRGYILRRMRELLVQDRHLRRMNPRGPAEAEP